MQRSLTAALWYQTLHTFRLSSSGNAPAPP
jgi:hypothetical protein